MAGSLRISGVAKRAVNATPPNATPNATQPFVFLLLLNTIYQWVPIFPIPPYIPSIINGYV